MAVVRSTRPARSPSRVDPLQESGRIPHHVAACKRDGFARIPGVFTRDEVNRLRAEAILACRGGNIEVRDGFPCLLFWPQSVYMRALALDPRLLDIVSAYYGHSDFELETQQYYFHLPGDSDTFAWHTDERFRPGVGNLYLQTAILIDDWTAENGAVEFIPGSHREPFVNSGDLRVFIRGERRGVRLLAEAGDVLTWSNTVVHGSERNEADGARAYFMNGFRARSLAEC